MSNFIYLPSLSSSLSKRCLARCLKSAAPNSWSSMAEFNNACSCSGSSSKALSKYASACDALPCSSRTTPSCRKKEYTSVKYTIVKIKLNNKLENRKTLCQHQLVFLFINVLINSIYNFSPAMRKCTIRAQARKESERCVSCLTW